MIYEYNRQIEKGEHTLPDWRLTLVPQRGVTDTRWEALDPHAAGFSCRKAVAWAFDDDSVAVIRLETLHRIK